MKRFLLLSAILATSSSVAVAEDFPIRKAGLWEITTTSSGGMGGGGGTTMQQCVDEASDKKLQEMGRSMGSNMGINCEKNEFRKEGSTYINESKCLMGPTTMTSKTVLSGDFSSSYSGETQATYAPPLMGMSNVTTKLSAAFKGACAADQKPGDVFMQGGMKMNVFDMANTMANSPKPDIAGLLDQMNKNQGAPQ